MRCFLESPCFLRRPHFVSFSYHPYMVRGGASRVHVPDHVPLPPGYWLFIALTPFFFPMVPLVLDGLYMFSALGAAVAYLVLARAACDPQGTCLGVRLRTLFHVPCYRGPCLRVRAASPVLYYPAPLVFTLGSCGRRHLRGVTL